MANQNERILTGFMWAAFVSLMKGDTEAAMTIIGVGTRQGMEMCGMNKNAPVSSEMDRLAEESLKHIEPTALDYLK